MILNFVILEQLHFNHIMNYLKSISNIGFCERCTFQDCVYFNQPNEETEKNLGKC